MKILRENRILFGTTTVREGNGKDRKVQQKVLSEVGFPSAKIVVGQQVHGNHVVHAAEDVERTFAETDGLVTELPQVALGIFTADCVPIFIRDTGARVVGVLHAGWRGAQKKILARAVTKIEERWGIHPEDLRINFGPHIRDCCYEVDSEVASLFPQTCVLKRGRRLMLSLGSALRVEAQTLGIPKENLGEGFSCTCCDSSFFSARRSGTKERMFSFIIKEGNHGKT